MKTSVKRLLKIEEIESWSARPFFKKTFQERHGIRRPLRGETTLKNNFYIQESLSKTSSFFFLQARLSHMYPKSISKKKKQFSFLYKAVCSLQNTKSPLIYLMEANSFFWLQNLKRCKLLNILERWKSYFISQWYVA